MACIENILTEFSKKYIRANYFTYVYVRAKRTLLACSDFNSFRVNVLICFFDKFMAQNHSSERIGPIYTIGLDNCLNTTDGRRGMANTTQLVIPLLWV